MLEHTNEKVYLPKALNSTTITKNLEVGWMLWKGVNASRTFQNIWGSKPKMQVKHGLKFWGLSEWMCVEPWCTKWNKIENIRECMDHLSNTTERLVIEDKIEIISGQVLASQLTDIIRIKSFKLKI